MIENTKARQLFADAFSGRSSRRDVLRRAAVLGMCVLALVPLFGASSITVAKDSPNSTPELPRGDEATP